MTQHVTGSFLVPLSVAQQSLGRGCLLTAYATQTLPTRRKENITLKGRLTTKKKSKLIHYSINATHPFLRQWRYDDVGVGDQEVCSEQLKLTVTSPQSVRDGWRTSLWDSFSWPGHIKKIIV